MEIKCQQNKIVIETKKFLLVAAGKRKFQSEMKQIDQ